MRKSFDSRTMGGKIMRKKPRNAQHSRDSAVVQGQVESAGWGVNRSTFSRKTGLGETGHARRASLAGVFGKSTHKRA